MQEPKNDNEKLPLLNQDLLNACIHCGLCLPACPTYLATGREMESPRGRIYLLNLWSQGKSNLTSRLSEHIESCLGCLGCQTACPSSVQYGEILNQARPHIALQRKAGTRNIMRFIFAKILPDYPKLQMLGKLLSYFQKTGKLSHPWLNKFMGKLKQWQMFMPNIPEFVPLPRQSWLSGQKTGNVQLFSGCVMNIFYNHVNHACLRLLKAQGNIVSVPEQTCCGALAMHAGELDIALTLAKKNIEYFEKTQGQIVVTAAGCGAMLKEYAHLLKDDKEFATRSQEFCDRVVDITEALASKSFLTKSKKIEKQVAYHAACHLAHAQGIHKEPISLLNEVEGLNLIPLQEAEHCCGSAGIFNLTHTDLSLDILKRKVDFIKETGANYVVTTNPGCLLQLEAGIREAGLDIKVLHLAELLDEAYSPDD